MLEAALVYYGIDWVAMVLTLLGIYLLGRKAQSGFVVMLCGNSCWVAVGFLTSSYAMIIANGLCAALNFWGFLRWRRDALLAKEGASPVMD